MHSVELESRDFGYHRENFTADACSTKHWAFETPKTNWNLYDITILFLFIVWLVCTPICLFSFIQSNWGHFHISPPPFIYFENNSSNPSTSVHAPGNIQFFTDAFNYVYASDHEKVKVDLSDAVSLSYSLEHWMTLTLIWKKKNTE